MRKGDRRTLLVDQKPVAVKFLGRGQFTTAWAEVDNSSSVLLVSADPAKEALALFAPASPHIPALERVAEDPASDRYIYRVPLYERLTARHSAAWAIYRACAAALDESRRSYFAMSRRPGVEIDIAQGAINILVEQGSLPEAITEALQDILDAGSNYGSSMTFEFAPRNLAVDGAGNLVFLDILFDAGRVRAKLTR